MDGIPDDARPALDMLRSLGGDALLSELTRTFLEFSAQQLAALAREAEAGNAATVAGIAHSLKSSARQLGAIALGEACAAAEAAGKAGKTELALDGVRAIQREFAAATPWLRSVAGEPPRAA